LMHKTIKRAGDDIEAMRFNTMIAALMEYTNGLARLRTAGVAEEAWTRAIEMLLLLLAPLAPHLSEELWARRGGPYSIHQQSWPEYEPVLATDETVEIAVQVNGKLRDRFTVAVDADEATVLEAAMASERVRAHVEGKRVIRQIFVPGRLLNIVVAG